MLQDVCDYGRCVAVDMTPQAAVDAAKVALKEEGFGVLCEIDVQKTLKEKIGAEIDSYVILGACNPNLANQSLREEPNIGLLLPCNLIVRQSKGATIVAAIDAAKMLSVVGNPALGLVAREVNQRLSRVIDKLDSARAS